MKLYPYDRKDLKKDYRPGKNQALLLEFVESGLDCAKLEGYTQKSARYCQSNLRTCAVRIGLANTVRIHTEGSNVFLLRVTDDDRK